MITGIVTADREAVLRLTLFDANNQPHEIDAIVDTGFNGNLTLSPDLIRNLGLSRLRSIRAILADGSQIIADVYEINLLWDGQPMSVSVSEVDGDALAGMSLMYGYVLNIPIVDGSTFTLQYIGTP